MLQTKSLYYMKTLILTCECTEGCRCAALPSIQIISIDTPSKESEPFEDLRNIIYSGRDERGIVMLEVKSECLEQIGVYCCNTYMVP